MSNPEKLLLGLRWLALMVNYTTSLKISPEEQEKLKIIKTKSVSIYGDEQVGTTFFRNIKISNADISYHIRNKPSLQKDGEEYPQIIVEESDGDDIGWEFICFGEVISISIIRDNLTWHYKERRWDVCVDIGIKFKLKDQRKEYFLMAIDSLAGFMELTTDDILQKDLGLCWALKADEFKTVCRREIPLLTEVL